MRPELATPEIQTHVTDALCAALDTMAFISPMPPECEGPAPCPDEARLVSIGFTGPTAGTLELLVGRGLGALLASNLLACSPEDDQALANADDILKELANVTCGTFLQAVSDGNATGYEMGIPQLAPLTPDDWAALVDAGQAAPLDADGHLIAARIR